MALAQERRARLQVAADYVGKELRALSSAPATIATLVAEHGARHRKRWDGDMLNCAGVKSTCTSGSDRQLLLNWHKSASVRLMVEAMG